MTNTNSSNRDSRQPLLAGSANAALIAFASFVLAVSPTQVHAEPALAAAVLPNSCSVEVGQTVTLFATVLNAGTMPAEGCMLGRKEPRQGGR